MKKYACWQKQIFFLLNQNITISKFTQKNQNTYFGRIFRMPIKYEKRCDQLQKIEKHIKRKMGNANDSLQSTVDAETTNYHYHPKFQNISCENTRGEDVIQIELPIENEEEYFEWIKKMKKYSENNLIGILSPHKYSFSRFGMCGAVGIVKAEYDNFPFILKQTIKERQRGKCQKFKEDQIWYLAYTLIEIGANFHVKERKVGDIRPLNIFINEETKIKVATQDSWPHQLCNYEKTKEYMEKTYLAPEELLNLKIGFTHPIVQISEAEAFSVGLTLLDVLLLDDSEKLYFKSNQISHSELQMKKEAVKEETQYSELLRHTILCMLQINVKNRLSLIEAYNWLKDYSQSILNMESWICKENPAKVLETIQKNPIKKMLKKEKKLISSSRKEKLRVESKESIYWQAARHQFDELFPQKSKPEAKKLKSPMFPNNRMKKNPSPKKKRNLQGLISEEQGVEQKDPFSSMQWGRVKTSTFVQEVYGEKRLSRRESLKRNFPQQKKTSVDNRHIYSQMSIEFLHSNNSSNYETPSFKHSELQSKSGLKFEDTEMNERKRKNHATNDVLNEEKPKQRRIKRNHEELFPNSRQNLGQKMMLTSKQRESRSRSKLEQIEQRIARSKQKFPSPAKKVRDQQKYKR